MSEMKAMSQEEEKTEFNWPGFIVGLVVGSGLFYLTIKLISALMFSRTAA
ncbi:MAG: hypothetical protein PHQ45_04440 [Acidaminococcaceae bacterium]|jgi:hypothetical protein|nr:hypothetical protein [Acidaminococcaceae bacterium]